MPISDIFIVIKWWILLLILGIIFIPLASIIFKNFFDRGYIFAKILGMAVISYIVFLLGLSRLVIFSQFEGILILLFFLIFFYIILPFLIKGKISKISVTIYFKTYGKIFIFEELLFFSGLLFWSYVRAFQPDVHGLEKYMDFGFINSILRSNYFPPTDLWFPPFPINYYYFGHLSTAVLTKISGISSNISFNLMLATLFSLTFVATFSLAATLYFLTLKKAKVIKIILAGVISAFFLTLAGNLHTVYLFFKPYQNDTPVPFWNLPISLHLFPNAYWYPNATRFIYHTIHEFPIYSFVVSDLHGHVIDIPFVLLTIASLFAVFQKKQQLIQKTSLLKLSTWKGEVILFGFLFSVMYMTNAWDGMVYFLLAFLILFFLAWQQSVLLKNTSPYIQGVLLLVVFGIVTAIFTLPFAINFKPASLVHGIGILCTPDFLFHKDLAGKEMTTTFGPFLLEPNHCQRSPLWQLTILYGFFYFWVISFIVFLKKTKKVLLTDFFVLLLIILATILIIIPEFFYLKDIYPEHYRANTMFKLVYQSFMMLSISSGYILVRIISYLRIVGIRKKIVIVPLAIWGMCALFVITLVSLYPYFAITSYYDIPKQYFGLNGTKYLHTSFPTDYQAIIWINAHIKGQPVILEAQGDSYTDYARVSANTGLPTVLGWTVHEWLWRGSYDVPAPRITDIANLYTSADILLTKQLLKKYGVRLVFIGDLERQKYPNLNGQKFIKLGTLIYRDGETKIYKIN